MSSGANTSSVIVVASVPRDPPVARTEAVPVVGGRNPRDPPVTRTEAVPVVVGRNFNCGAALAAGFAGAGWARTGSAPKPLASNSARGKSIFTAWGAGVFIM